jgi:hypothetical protein
MCLPPLSAGSLLILLRYGDRLQPLPVLPSDMVDNSIGHLQP